MRLRRSVALAVTAVLLTLVVACSSNPSSPAGATPVGTWGAGGEGQPQLVLAEGGELSGTDGCNQLVGSWELREGTIEFGEVGSTMMACPEVDTWLSALHTATIDGDTLHLKDATGTEIGTLARS